MTAKKSPPSKKAPTTSWDMSSLSALAESTSFPATAGIFSHTYGKASPGAAVVVVQGKISIAGSTTTACRVPNDLKAWIEQNVAGPWTTGLVALADAMREHLETTGQTLTTRNKESN